MKITYPSVSLFKGVLDVCDGENKAVSSTGMSEMTFYVHDGAKSWGFTRYSVASWATRIN